MKINFIGHGLDDNAEKNVGKVLCSAFNNPKHYNNFIGLTAFATNSGLSKIISYISDAKASFKNIIWYIGVNDQVTTREALQLLLDHDIETYIFFIEDKLFHPKVYIFEGEVRNKIIVGSSNLTQPGLFKRNIEASVEVEYDNPDPSGKKFRKQISDYFKHLFNNSHSDLKLLTVEYLKELVEKNIVRDELHWLKNNKYENQNESVGNLPKRKKRRADKIEKDLGNIKEKDKIERDNLKANSNSKIAITDEYLRTWSFYFEELKKFKAENTGNTIVPVTHHDKRLYSWYRKQKVLYHNFDENGNRLIPIEHKEALDGINFFWEDGHILREIRIWEKRLKECVDYCKSKNLSYVWVTWEKKDPKFPFKTQASWCIRQRRRFYKLDKKLLSPYEEKRLREVNFKLEKLVNAGGLLDDDSWIESYDKLVIFKDLFGHANPSQTVHPDPKNPNPDWLRLGKWVNDQRHLKNNGVKNRRTGEKKYLIKIREELLDELGVDWDYEENEAKKKFEKDASEYVAMRRLYPTTNPKGEARKIYRKILDWEAGQKFRFDVYPDWRKNRLIELKIIKPL